MLCEPRGGLAARGRDARMACALCAMPWPWHLVAARGLAGSAALRAVRCAIADRRPVSVWSVAVVRVAAVKEGAVFGLLGPNGAGKTTTVHILSTLVTPDKGHATIAGYDVETQAHQVRQLIGLAGRHAAPSRTSTDPSMPTLTPQFCPHSGVPGLNARPPDHPPQRPWHPAGRPATHATRATLAAHVREGSRKSATIANDFIIAKDFRTYKRIILRQDKSLRDHVPTRPVGWSLRDVSAAR
jgi:hypothetical protein